MADYPVAACDRHRQTTAVALEVAADADIFRRCRHWSCFHLALLSDTILFCLAQTTVSLFLLLFALGCQSLCLGFFFTGTGFGQSLLTGCGFCTALGFCCSAGLLTGNFLCNETVNLGIQCSVLLFLVSNDSLDGLLLFLQSLHYVLLFGLFALQLPTFPLTLGQQARLLVLGLVQLLVLLGECLLLTFYLVALYTLIGCIFTHKPHAAEHLCQIVCTKDEHQLALRRPVAMHITHGLHIAFLASCQLLL